MALALAVVVGLLYTMGVYLMLRRNIVKLIFGLMVLGHASNLLLFTVGGLVRGKPPLVPPGATARSASTTFRSSTRICRCRPSRSSPRGPRCGSPASSITRRPRPRR